MFQRPFDRVEHKSRKEELIREYHQRRTKPLAVDIDLKCVSKNIHSFCTSEILQMLLFHVLDNLWLGFSGSRADLQT